MLDRQKMLEAAKNADDKNFLSRLCDLAVSADKQGITKYSSFLSMHEQELTVKKIKYAGDINIGFWGGYLEAERKLLSISPSYLKQAEFSAYPLKYLEITAAFDFEMLKALSHRDFLGAVLALGIKREKVGDIAFPRVLGTCLFLASRAWGNVLVFAHSN